MYEIIPQGSSNLKIVPTFKIDFRYKRPDSDVSIPLALQIFDEGNSFGQSTDYMKFTASIASFGMLLSDSDYKGTSSYSSIVEWLNATHLIDEHNFKSEFKNIVEAADGL